MGDNDLYEGKVITDTDGNQYMAKKSGGEYVLKLIWKAPKEPEKGGLEDEVDTSNYETSGDTGFPDRSPPENDAGASGG